MTKLITQIDKTADKFELWVDRTNDVINAVSTEVVTANSSSGGSSTTGNCVIDGIFSANTLVAVNALRGGTIATADVLTITSNVVVDTSSISVGNTTINLVINSTSISVSNSTIGSVQVSPFVINVQTSGTSGQIVDSFLKSSFRGAEYLLSIADNDANAHQISKVLVIHAADVTNHNEYGVLYTNNQLGVFSANANATHTRLVFTPTVSNTQIKATRITVKV